MWHGMDEEDIMKVNTALAKYRVFTADFLDALPEGAWVEMIDGQLFLMASPTRMHQRLQLFLGYEIETYIRKHAGDCEVYLPQYDVRLDKDNKTIVFPDLMVVCEKDKLSEKECLGAPEFVVEIVSPSSKKRDYEIKFKKYQAAGVREYWILDWKRNQIQVNRFDQDIVEYYTFEDKVKVGIFEDLEIDFSTFKR